MPAPRRRGRGYIETLPSGSFRAVVPASIDPLTRRRRALRETTLTLPEAEKALTRLPHQVDEQRHPKSAITVREAIEQWREVADVGVPTREQYDDRVRLYIDPTL